jgi:hypothetical protein
MSNDTVKEVPREKKMSVLDQIRKLDEQREKLLNDAKQEALKKAEAAIEELNELGFSYKLSQSGAPAARKQRQRDPNKPCDICGFVTDPPHDGRVHRSQGDKKKAFTAAELTEKGYKKK